jgi:uncharacterized membrane protein
MSLSKTPNAELMKQARATLHGHWWLVLGFTLAYLVISFSASGIHRIGNVVSLIVSGPLSVGMALFSLSLVRRQEARFEQLFHGFAKFANAFAAYLLLVLIVIAWALLLIVPGVIAALRYSMVFFILADEPGLGPVEALKKSKAMMEGNKKKLFHLLCRFIGWGLLCIPTAGLGILWVFPYVHVTMAHFYCEIREAGGGR